MATISTLICECSSSTQSFEVKFWFNAMHAVFHQCVFELAISVVCKALMGVEIHLMVVSCLQTMCQESAVNGQFVLQSVGVHHKKFMSDVNKLPAGQHHTNLTAIFAMLLSKCTQNMLLNQCNHMIPAIVAATNCEELAWLAEF